MLYALEHAEPVSLSCLLLASSGSYSRSSSIFETHPVFLVEKSLKTYLAALGYSNIGCTIISYVEAFTCGVQSLRFLRRKPTVLFFLLTVF